MGAGRGSIGPLRRNWRAFIYLAVPGVGELRRRHGRSQRAQLAIVVGLVVAAVLCWALLLVPSGFVVGHPVLAGLVGLFVVGCEALALAAALPPKRQATPLESAGSEELGRYSEEELQEMMERLGSTFPGREKAHLYVVDSPVFFYGTGMAVNAPLWSWSRRLNAVYVSKDLLRLLRPRELEALLAHELAHFHGASALLCRAALLVAACRASLILACLAALPWGLGAFPFVAIVATVALDWASRWPLLRLVGPGHELEHLADVAAAERCGRLPMVNALLRLGSHHEVRAEALHQVLLAADEDPSIYVPTAIEACVEALPEGEVTLAEARPLIGNALADLERGEESQAPSEKAPAPERSPAHRALEPFRCPDEWRKVDWRDYDTLRPDGELDEDELELFGTALLESPDKAVFLLPAEQPTVPEGLLRDVRHPKTRDRILYLLREAPAPQGAEEQRPAT